MKLSLVHLPQMYASSGLQQLVQFWKSVELIMISFRSRRDLYTI